MNELPLAIFLMGPTAVGKTDFAIALSKELPVEIISVDSAMVYQGMNIGTGKPTLEEQKIAAHHLIDIRDPKHPYSAALFRQDALKIMSEITKRGHIPLLVGGTFLYFKALEQGLSPLPSHDPIIRQKLLEEEKSYGLDAMYQRLVKIDPLAAKRIHPNDPQRIQRALEVYEITKQPMSTFFSKHEISAHQFPILPTIHFPYRSLTFALLPVERQWLHQRIETRFHHMLKLGLEAEVRELYNRHDLNPNLPSMRSVGYRQVWQYLAGECSFEQMVQAGIAATRQLAKRQLTWLRSLTNIQHYLKIEENNHLALLQTMINCVFSEAGIR